LDHIFCIGETWSLVLKEEYKLRVFDKRVLRNTGDLRKLRTEKLHDLYSSPDMIRVIKSETMIWAGHVKRNACRVFAANLQVRDYLEDLCIDKKIILI